MTKSNVDSKWSRLLLRFKRTVYDLRGKGYGECTVRLCFAKGLLLSWQLGEPVIFEPSDDETCAEMAGQLAKVRRTEPLLARSGDEATAEDG